MRYFRFVVHPLSPARDAQGDVNLRMRMLGTGQMIHRDFRDGDWLAVPDQSMGIWGIHGDFLSDPDTPGVEPYKFWQEGVPNALELVGALAFLLLLTVDNVT